MLCRFLLPMCFAPQRRALLPPLNFQTWSEHGVFCKFLLPNLLRVTTFAPPRMVCLPLFTSKCASRHNAVHFLDITTSKSGPTLMCFVHFDFGMCFVPQRRALFPHLNLKAQRLVLFPHLNFQQWSEHDLFCTFLLPNVFRATTANKFSFISNLASYLRTRRLSEPTFRPSGATKHWKNTMFRDFPTFSRTCIFSLLTFSISDLLHLLSSPF